jgi:hypothetical protein
MVDMGEVWFPGTSGGVPISEQPLRMGELIATFALAQDNAFGQPLESQLRSCLLATSLCEEAGFDNELRETIYWVALLPYIGCTGHAHEVASVFGDEIAIRAQTLVHDAANPAEVMHDVLAFATAGHPPAEREQIVQAIQEGAHAWAVHNFASGCEVADMLVQRLDFGPGIRDALAFTFERWNGNGFPKGARGEEIPLAASARSSSSSRASCSLMPSSASANSAGTIAASRSPRSVRYTTCPCAASRAAPATPGVPSTGSSLIAHRTPAQPSLCGESMPPKTPSTRSTTHGARRSARPASQPSAVSRLRSGHVLADRTRRRLTCSWWASHPVVCRVNKHARCCSHALPGRVGGHGERAPTNALTTAGHHP